MFRWEFSLTHKLQLEAKPPTHPKHSELIKVGILDFMWTCLQWSKGDVQAYVNIPKYWVSTFRSVCIDRQLIDWSKKKNWYICCLVWCPIVRNQNRWQNWSSLAVIVVVLDLSLWYIGWGGWDKEVPPEQIVHRIYKCEQGSDGGEREFLHLEWTGLGETISNVHLATKYIF